jgi:acid phosphatase (class A)
LFSSAAGAGFQVGKLPKTESLLQRVKREMGELIDTPKNHWKRKRPYQLDPELSLGNPEPSFGYPSGHSTRGTVYSLIIAELFPERREPILAFGRTIGWDRVLIGKHFPTDIQAGRVLGKAIFRELLSSPAFQRDLEAAKSEILATQMVKQ